MKQNILKFNFKFKSNDFFISEKNFFAYEMISKWPEWNNQFLYIYGPEMCGKTLISEIWTKKSKAIYVSHESFDKKIPDDFDINFVKNNNWVLDDVDKLIEKNKNINNKIFSFINVLKTTPNTFLLMTGLKSPKHINCYFKDVTSRMLSSIVIEIGYPDELLLSKIIEKYLNDRNVLLDKRSLSYILDRIERSYESAIKIAKQIDMISLEKKSKISIHLLKSIFERNVN